MNLVQKAKPPSTTVPGYTGSSTQVLTAANRRLDGVLREFRNIQTNINTSDFTYAVAQAERRLSDAASQAKGATDDVKKAMAEASRTSERMKDMQLFTAYPKAFKDHAKGFTSKYGELVKTISDKAQIQLSTDEVLKIQDDLGRTYDNARSLLEKAAAFGLDQERSLTAEESKLANFIEAQLQKEMNQLDIYIQNAEDTTDIAKALGDAAESRALGMTKDTKDFVTDLQHIKDQFERRDFVGAARGVSGLKKKGKAPGMQALNKAAAGMSKGMAAMLVVEMVVKSVKQAVGYFLGLNNAAAELNKKVAAVHGLVSQGVDVTARIDGKAIDDNAKKYQKLFLEFGVDSGTYLTPEQILSITGAYEAQGIKLKEVTADEAGFSQRMKDVVGYSLMTGMSYEQLAGIMADWQQNINMDTGSISATMNAFVKTQIDTGMPAEILYETTKTLNFDYSMWGTSMLTALAMQKHNLQKGKGNIVAKNKSLQALLDHIKGLGTFDYSVMLDSLPSGKFNEVVDKDLANAEKMYQGAMTDADKSKWKYTIGKLKSVKNLDRVRAMRLYFEGDAASMEARLEIFQKGLKAGSFGKDIQKAIRDKSMNTSQEQNLKRLIGAEGMSDKQFSEILLSLDNIVLDDFDAYAALDGAEMSLAEKKKQEELRRKAIEAAMPQLKTFKELTENIWNKWMSKIIQSADKIIAFLRGCIQLNPFGTGDDLDPGSVARKAEAESALIESIVKASQMEKGKDRDKAVDELRNQIGAAKTAGVDIQSVADRMQTKGVAPDIINRLREAGGGGGGSGNMGAVASSFVKSGQGDAFAKADKTGNFAGGVACAMTVKEIAKRSGIKPEILEKMSVQAPGTLAALLKAGFIEEVKQGEERAGDLAYGNWNADSTTAPELAKRYGGMIPYHTGIVSGKGKVVDASNAHGSEIGLGQRVVEHNINESAFAPGQGKFYRFKPGSYTGDSTMKSPDTQPTPKVNPNPGSAGSNQPSTASSTPGAQAGSIAHRNNQHNKCIKVKLNGNMMCQEDADALKKKAAKK